MRGRLAGAAGIPGNPNISRRLSPRRSEVVLRCHPHPHALLGPAAALRSLLAELDEGDSDADRLTSVLRSNRHDMVVGTISHLLHVLDGSGTDVVIVAGRAHAGGEQPLVLVDPGVESPAPAETKVLHAEHGCP